jgi:hypothetical protein
MMMATIVPECLVDLGNRSLDGFHLRGEALVGT